MKISRIATSFIFAFLLSACSSLPLGGRHVSVIADVNANQSMATALDLVFVYDKAAMDLLPKTGPAWFSQKVALMMGLGSGVEVVSVQVPPAAVIQDLSLPAGQRKAVAVYAYANYLSAAGQAVGNLTPYKKVVIRLKADTVVYSEGE